MATSQAASPVHWRAVLTVFRRFLLLGCSSFGGPVAHLGYFRTCFVSRLRWLDDSEYARLVSLCQFLPGPASSQVGFAIGLRRAGLAGAVAAFAGFTLPSALLLYALSVGQRWPVFAALFQAVVPGLKVLAVAVVADAVVGLHGRFCSSLRTRLLAGVTAGLLLAWPGLFMQLLVLAAAALAGAAWLPAVGTVHAEPRSPLVLSTRATVALVVFCALCLAVLLAPARGYWGLFADFFRSGSLVFGGGHVVLPLLQASVGEALSPDRFLAGYAAAQAVPGPMFTLATFIGAELDPAAPWWGALVATGGIFLPGFLLLLALGGVWERLTQLPRLAAAVAGINAAVVGLLLAALVHPVGSGALVAWPAWLLALCAFVALRWGRLPLPLLIVLCAGGGLLFSGIQ